MKGEGEAAGAEVGLPEGVEILGEMAADVGDSETRGPQGDLPVVDEETLHTVADVPEVDHCKRKLFDDVGSQLYASKRRRSVVSDELGQESCVEEEQVEEVDGAKGSKAVDVGVGEKSVAEVDLRGVVEAALQTVGKDAERRDGERGANVAASDAMDVEVFESVSNGEPTAALCELVTRAEYDQRIQGMRRASVGMQHAAAGLEIQLRSCKVQLEKEKKELERQESINGGGTLKERYESRMARLAKWREKGAIYREADEGRAAGIERRIASLGEQLVEAKTLEQDARRHLVDCTDVSVAGRRALEVAVESYSEAVAAATMRLESVQREWESPVKCGLTNKYIRFQSRLQLTFSKLESS